MIGMTTGVTTGRGHGLLGRRVSVRGYLLLQHLDDLFGSGRSCGRIARRCRLLASLFVAMTMMVVMALGAGDLSIMSGLFEELVFGRVAYHRLVILFLVLVLAWHFEPDHMVRVDESVVEAFVLDKVDRLVMGRVLVIRIISSSTRVLVRGSRVSTADQLLFGLLRLFNITYTLLHAQIDLRYTREHLLGQALLRLVLGRVLNQILGHVKERVLGPLELGHTGRALCRTVRLTARAKLTLLLLLLLDPQLFLDELLHLRVLVSLVGLPRKIAVHILDNLVATLLQDLFHIDEAARLGLPGVIVREWVDLGSSVLFADGQCVHVDAILTLPGLLQQFELLDLLPNRT